MEESARRKERLQALRREASQNPNPNPSNTDQSAPGLLSNPFNDSSPSLSPSLTPQSSSRFDYYTDPLSSFSGNKKNKSIDSSSPNPNGSPNSMPRVISYGNSSTPFKGHVGQRSPLWQPNFHGSPQNPPSPFGSPVSGYYNEHARFSSSSDGSVVPRFNQITPEQRSSYPSPQQQQRNQNVGLEPWLFSNPINESNVVRFNQSPTDDCWPQQAPRLQQDQNGSEADRFFNSMDDAMSSASRFNQTPNQISCKDHQPHPQPHNQQNQSGSQSVQFFSPSTENPMPKFNQVANRDKFLSQQPHPQPSTPLQQHHYHQRQQHKSVSQPRYNGSAGRGSSWSDSRQSSGGRGSPWSDSRGTPSPSPSPGSGGRGIYLSEPRGGSGGRGTHWMNSRGRGGRGQGGSPSPNQMRGGRGNHANASARERPDLFVKKSMVEDPWKSLVPVLIDSLGTTGVGNAGMLRGRGNWSDIDSPGSSQLGSASMKKAKLLQVKDNFQSGPSLAESLASALFDAVGEESCS